MGNVRSLSNKVDELAALTRHQREYRQCSLLLFTESWLTELTPDANIALEGFQIRRADRTKESGKRKGGGLAVYINDKWCNPGHITVKEQICSRDVELLAVSMRPYYLPRDFSHIIAITAYIPPSADACTACDVIHSVTSKLQTQHPQALILISGDFNHAPLSSTLPNFKQYVTCNTRDNKTLDLFYANTKDAYNTAPLPPLGKSDHNLVHLLPVYKPIVHRCPVNTRQVRIWSDGAYEALKDCFETTDWEVLRNPHGEDVDGLTDCITDYINFCVENTVPTKTVRCFSNSKPWVTPDLKALLEEKKRAFRSGNKEELRRVQKELRRKIRESKDQYRKRMEGQLQQNNAIEIWRGLKTISGFKESNTQPVGNLQWANDLNSFFNRFDLVADPPSAQLAPPFSAPSIQPCALLPLTREQVRRELRKMKVRKAAGPDNISPGILRHCADQLCGIVKDIFNLSLKQERVPVLWKTSCVVPIPKTAHPSDLNGYRPVALTSHLMKALERLVLAHLRPLMGPTMDPLQFAYQPGIGVEDAITYLLHRSLAHLEKAGSTVRIMFFDLSSAFNTIKPTLLGSKMERAGVDHHLITWTMDYLTNRPQYVRLKDCVSETLLCSTGAPQGTVLAPFLFTLYTADFTHNTSTCHLQKFSDDSAVVGYISDDDEREYREVTRDFVDWCQQNCLQINTAKTKELVVDFRRTKFSSPTSVNIQGRDIEIVKTYKYLGVHLNNKLDWSDNTHALYKKGQSRLHLLRRLRSFGIQGGLLHSFYDSVVASAIFYGIVCWGGGITAADRKKLDKLIRKASSVLGCALDPVGEVAERRMLAKLTSIMDNPSHPLQEEVAALSSSFSDRLLHLRCGKERYRSSFLPTAVRLYNQNLPKQRLRHSLSNTL